MMEPVPMEAVGRRKEPERAEGQTLHQ